MCKKIIGVEEVAEATGMSRAYAYKLIGTLNAELKAQGRIIIPGHVDAAYFNERLFGDKKVVA